MTGASADYYARRAREARMKAASATNAVVREQYIELAKIYEMSARRAAVVANDATDIRHAV